MPDHAPLTTGNLDFHLPPELIAQEPAAERSASRLLHYRTAHRSIAHRAFADLPSLLRPGDLLVFNDVRVLPAKFVLRKATGGRVEGLFIRELGAGRWRALLKNLGPARQGDVLYFAGEADVSVRVAAKLDDGEHELAIDPPSPASELLARVGRMPLPPYIRREKDADARDAMDRTRYQTVFARRGSAVAAPTAALHFTPAIFEQLEVAGVQRAFVTLDVGMGTFKPITADRLDRHAMHEEHYVIAPDSAAAINAAKAARRRVLAVGTTAARVLESQPAGQPIEAKADRTSIFIRPPYAWKHVNALITNFHLPRSTLIALVAARVGLAEQRRIYAEAIRQRYRFFSYGDAMFID